MGGPNRERRVDVRARARLVSSAAPSPELVGESGPLLGGSLGLELGFRRTFAGVPAIAVARRITEITDPRVFLQGEAHKEFYETDPLSPRLEIKDDGDFALWFEPAGISPKYANHSIGQINAQIRDELHNFEKLHGGMVLDEMGPLWYRGLSNGGDELLSHVNEVLSNFGVERIVVGHSYANAAITPRRNGLARNGWRLATESMSWDSRWTSPSGRRTATAHTSRPRIITPSMTAWPP